MRAGSFKALSSPFGRAYHENTVRSSRRARSSKIRRMGRRPVTMRVWLPIEARRTEGGSSIAQEIVTVFVSPLVSEGSAARATLVTRAWWVSYGNARAFSLTRWPTSFRSSLPSGKVTSASQGDGASTSQISSPSRPVSGSLARALTGRFFVGPRFPTESASVVPRGLT